MSLDFYTDKMTPEGKAMLKTDGEWNGFCEALSFTMMRIRMGQITKQNWMEVAYRVRFLTQIDVCMMQKWDKEADRRVRLNVTTEQIKKLIGFRTNVSSDTRKQFMKSEINFAAHEAERRLKYDLQNILEEEAGPTVVA